MTQNILKQPTIVKGPAPRTNLAAGLAALADPVVVHMEPGPAEAVLMHIRKLEADNERLRGYVDELEVISGMYWIIMNWFDANPVIERAFFRHEQAIFKSLEDES